MLTRGKLHVAFLPEDFAGDDPKGAAPLMAKVRAALNVRFQGTTPPRVVFTDRAEDSSTLVQVRLQMSSKPR